MRRTYIRVVGTWRYQYGTSDAVGGKSNTTTTTPHQVRACNISDLLINGDGRYEQLVFGNIRSFHSSGSVSGASGKEQAGVEPGAAVRSLTPALRLGA
jgi:hypothetical protein